MRSEYVRRFKSKIKENKNRRVIFWNMGDSYGIRKFKEAHKDYLYVLGQQNCLWK